jgi:hypothetical protein
VILHLPKQLVHVFEAKLLLAWPLMGAERMKLARGDLVAPDGVRLCKVCAHVSDEGLSDLGRKIERRSLDHRGRASQPARNWRLALQRMTRPKPAPLTATQLLKPYDTLTVDQKKNLAIAVVNLMQANDSAAEHEPT